MLFSIKWHVQNKEVKRAINKHVSSIAYVLLIILTDAICTIMI